jgi:hypothetical protein
MVNIYFQKRKEKFSKHPNIKIPKENCKLGIVKNIISPFYVTFSKFPSKLSRW